MKLEFSGQIFEIYSDIKFYKNPFIGNDSSRAERQPAMTKLIICFYNFANAPEDVK